LNNPEHLLVKTIPAGQCRVSEDLKSLWTNATVIKLGNSTYPFKWIPAQTLSGQVEIPLLIGLPPHLHAAYRNHQACLGPVMAVLVDEYLGGARPFTVQTLLLKELIERASARGVLVYVITPQAKLEANHLEGYCWRGGQWIKQSLPYPDLVYNRYFGKQYSQRDVMIKELNKRGAQLINSSLPNKWDCYQWLKTDLLLAAHLPETRLYKSIKDVSQMLSRYPEIYLKPRAGFRGAGIARLSKAGAGYLLISSTGKTVRLTSIYRLPSYIHTNS